MNLYLISQSQNNGWDTYDSAVVVAENADDAAEIHPGSDCRIGCGEGFRVNGTWCDSPSRVKVEMLGPYLGDYKYQVVCASFNAG